VHYAPGYAGRAGLAARERSALAIARAHGLKLLSHWPMMAIGVECYLMEVPPDVSTEEVLAALERDSRAAWAQPMQTFSSRAYNDPLYDIQPTASAWQLEQLHEVTQGRGVLIAQIDSGVEVDHPDLQGQLRFVENTVDERYAAELHGTAVAGVIAARAGNAVGIVGIAPAAKLLVLRACREPVAGKATCDSLSIAKALQRAVELQAQVVNLSIGGPRDRLLGALLDALLARGVIVVAAAGAVARNDPFPASHIGVIAVADARAPPSPGLLTAVGADVPTTLPGGRWGVVSGASFAAAAVTGVAALLIEVKPEAGATRIDAWLRLRPQSASAAEPTTPALVDACRSVSLAAGRCACRCAGVAVSAEMDPAGPRPEAAVSPRDGGSPRILLH
jgi:subtilisin family serine protease